MLRSLCVAGNEDGGRMRLSTPPAVVGEQASGEHIEHFKKKALAITNPHPHLAVQQIRRPDPAEARRMMNPRGTAKATKAVNDSRGPTVTPQPFA